MRINTQDNAQVVAAQKFIQDLILKYQLRPTDIYLHQDGWKIISSDGIANIIQKEKYNVSKFLAYFNGGEKSAVVSCTVTEPSTKVNPRSYSALGEASPDNNTFIYPVNVAEKRAESRAVLKMAGLYDQGVRGEEEIDHMVMGLKMIDKKREQTSVAMTAAVEGISEVSTRKTVKALKVTKGKGPESLGPEPGLSMKPVSALPSEEMPE